MTTTTTTQGRTYHTTHHVAARLADERRAQLEEARALRARTNPEPPPAPRAMQRNAVVWLHVHGHLRAEHLRAAQEIERMHYACTAGVRGKVTASYWERTPTGPASDDWPDSMRIAYAERFVPWSTWAGSVALKRHTLREATLMLCVDSLGYATIGRTMGIDPKTALRRLQGSLWEYARIGGWTQGIKGETDLP